MWKAIVLLAVGLGSCYPMALSLEKFDVRRIDSAIYLVCNIKGPLALMREIPHCMAELNLWACRDKNDRSPFLLQDFSRSSHDLDAITSRAVMLRVSENAVRCHRPHNVVAVNFDVSFEWKTLPGMNVFVSRNQGDVELPEVHTGHLRRILHDLKLLQETEKGKVKEKVKEKVNYSFIDMSNLPILEVLVVERIDELPPKH